MLLIVHRYHLVEYISKSQSCYHNRDHPSVHREPGMYSTDPRISKAFINHNLKSCHTSISLIINNERLVRLQRFHISLNGVVVDTSGGQPRGETMQTKPRLPIGMSLCVSYSGASLNY